MPASAMPGVAEALFFVAFPGDQPHPAATVTIATPASIEITLDGPETPLFRVMALAVLAGVLCDDEGPEMIPGGRYTCGEFRGVFFLIRTPISAEQQRELETIGRSIAEEIGE